MPSGKTVKLILYELLQFLALTVTIFVIMERFASLIYNVKDEDLTAYWLVVAASVAYVTSVTLVVWVPVKYQILRKRRRFTEITQWRPTAMVFLIMCTLPCFAILIASSKVQVDTGKRFDHFAELPTSLVLFSLICVDIVERIRPFKLRGQTEGLDLEFYMPGPVTTQLEPVATISRQLHTDEDQKGQAEARDGSIPSRWQDSPIRSAPRAAYPYFSSPALRSQSGYLGSLWRRDARTEVLVDCFLFWFDTVELLRVAEEPSIFYSAWVFPIYILAFLSTLRVIIVPYSPLLSSAGVALQDLPFFIVRITLLAVYGDKISVLYPLKNMLVTVTFVYFTFLTRAKIFRTQTMF